jgi:hypothetical protein
MCIGITSFMRGRVLPGRKVQGVIYAARVVVVQRDQAMGSSKMSIAAVNDWKGDFVTRLVEDA